MRLTRSLLVLITLLFSYSCSHAPTKESGKLERERNYGRLILFLNGPAKSNVNINFKLAGVAVFSQGTWEPLPLSAQQVSSADLADHQIIIAESKLPAKAYDAVRFAFSSARLKSGERSAELSIPSEGVVVDFRFTVLKNQDTTVFVNWNVDESVDDTNVFVPAFGLKTEVRGVSSRLGYVANEGSNNVTVINRDLDEVFTMIAVEKAPCGLAVNNTKSRLRVYVTNSGSGSLSIIDPTSNQVEKTVPVRFGTKPRGVAVAQAQSGKEYVFVSNYGSNNVSVIDADTYEELTQVRVGIAPGAIVADPPFDTINQMRGPTSDQINRWRAYREQNVQVYVANTASNTVSVILFNTADVAVQNVYTLAVGSSPAALDVDTLRGKVYVANHDSDSVSIINSLDVMDGNTTSAVTSLTNLGTGGTGIAVDPFFARLHLLKDSPAQLVFLQTPADTATGSLKSFMTPITGVLPVGTRPRFLTMDPEGNKLYITDSDGTVHVVDKTTRRLIKDIPAGNNPCEIRMIPLR